MRLLSKVITSDTYTFYAKSGAINEAGSVGFEFSTNNALTDATAKLFVLKSGETSVLSIAATSTTITFTPLTSTQGALIFSSPGILGTVRFISPSTTNQFGVYPTGAAFTTSVLGVGAVINLLSNNGGSCGFAFQMEGSGLINCLRPTHAYSTYDIGNTSYRFRNLYLLDTTGCVYFGTKTSLNHNGTDFVVDITTGLLKVNAAGSWTTGSGTPTVGTNCPAADATTPHTWLKLKANDGDTVYVPAWK